MAPILPYNFPKRKTECKDILKEGSLIHFQSVFGFILIICLILTSIGGESEFELVEEILVFLLIPPFHPKHGRFLCIFETFLSYFI